MPTADTSAAAQAMQFDLQRSMSGEQRLLLAFEMSEFARDLCRARIRQEHSDWSEQQITREIIRLAFLPGTLPELR